MASNLRLTGIGAKCFRMSEIPQLTGLVQGIRIQEP